MCPLVDDCGKMKGDDHNGPVDCVDGDAPLGVYGRARTGGSASHPAAHPRASPTGGERQRLLCMRA